jgi:hypothetical protein
MKISISWKKKKCKLCNKFKEHNACYHIVQNTMLSCLLSKSVRFKTNETKFYLLFHGYETWSLMLREENRLMVSEKRVLRRIFGPRREEVTRS